MGQYLSSNFPEQIEKIRQLRASNQVFDEICAEFEEIAEEQERVNAAVSKALPEKTLTRDLLDLTNTLNGLLIEIRQHIALVSAKKIAIRWMRKGQRQMNGLIPKGEPNV